MKKIKLILIVLIGILVFISCKRDDSDYVDNDLPIQLRFMFDGTEYATPKGYIISSFEEPNNSLHTIYLMNGTMINNEYHGEGCDYSNELTHGIGFSIISSSTIELVNGTYNYKLNATDSSLKGVSITTNVIVVDNCVEVEDDSIDEIEPKQISSGNLIIEKNGNSYNLTYTIVTDLGTVTGNYNGELQLVTDLSK